jgi:hypothetical protein
MLMVLPPEHVNEPDATGDSADDNDNQFQTDSRPESGLSRPTNAPSLEPIQNSRFVGHKWSACN